MISSIKKFTDKILKCKPDAWSTRWPWVLLFGILVHLVLAAIVFITSWDVRYDSQYQLWVSFISIIMILALVFYLIYLLRFNVFKRFGKLSKWHYVGTFLTYFFTIALVVSWGYNPFAVTSVSSRLQYNDVQIAKDINRINVLINTIEHDSIPHLWTRRKVILDDLSGRQTRYGDDHFNNYDYNYKMAAETAAEATMEAAGAVTTAEGYKGYIVLRELYYEDQRISRKDSFDFFAMLKTDSVKRIDDTSYYRFYSPGYTYVTAYHQFFNDETEEELDKVALFHKVVKNKPLVQDYNKLKEELRSLVAKYWAKDYNSYHYSNYPSNFGESVTDPNRYPCPQGYREYLDKKYKLGNLDEGIKNISDRYYMWKWNNLGFLIYPMYYISLALALMLFLFRHNRKKSFFYTILAAVVLFILSVTFLALFSFGSEVVLGVMILYMVTFGIIAARIFNAKRKSLIQDIAKNLFIFFLPILPLVITALYYDIKKSIFRSTHNTGTPEYSDLYHQAFQYEGLAINGAQIFGFILLIFLLHFVFSKMLRKSYALPEN